MNYKPMKAIITASLFVLCFEAYTLSFISYEKFVNQIVTENKLSLDINDPSIKFILEQFYKVSCRLTSYAFHEEFTEPDIANQIDELKNLRINHQNLIRRHMVLDKENIGLKKINEKLIRDIEKLETELAARPTINRYDCSQSTFSSQVDVLQDRFDMFRSQPIKIVLGCTAALVLLGCVAKKGFNCFKQYCAKRRHRAQTIVTEQEITVFEIR